MEVAFWISIIFIAYVYWGYPILIALLACLRPKETYSMSAYPAVSLIIAAYNEEEVIKEKISNALELDYPRNKLEIIVAADGSDDGTKKIVDGFKLKNVICSFIPQRQGKMAAILRAVKIAKGEIVVFSDANNLFNASALKYLVQPFKNPKVGGTTGTKHIQKEEDSLAASEGIYWKYESWIKKNESRLNSCTAAAGEILAIRKHLLPVAVQSVINDDFFLLLKIIRDGYRMVYVPQAKSSERVSANAQDEIKRRSRIAAGRFQAVANSWRWLPWNNPAAVWQIISHKYFRLFVPIAMMLAFLSNLYVVFSHLPLQNNSDRLYFWLMITQTIFYILAWVGSRVIFNGVWKIFYLPAFLVNSNLASLQGLGRFLKKEQSNAWEKVNRRKNH